MILTSKLRLIGVGLGSRTVSLRSTNGPGTIGPKESMTGRSGTNIVITHDGNRPSLSQDSIIRFILLDLHGITLIDSEGVQMLIQVSTKFFPISKNLGFCGTQ